MPTTQSPAAIAREPSQPPETPPLAVDVDGTLLRGDLLAEGAARLLAASPAKLLAALLHLLPGRAGRSGRAGLKRAVAQAAPAHESDWVFIPQVQECIAEAQAAGREVYLASAADETVVAPLAKHINAAGYLASDGTTNNSGRAKAAALTARFGPGGFDYIGNSRADLPAWQSARRAIAVNATPALARQVQALPQSQVLSTTEHPARAILRAARPQQWLKNLLLFAPLIAAHASDPMAYIITAVFFIAFSLCAAGNYALNDLLDLPHDKKHRTKHLRPLPAGAVSPSAMLLAGVALITAGLVAAFAVAAVAAAPAAFVYLLLYLAAAFAYSLYCKRAPLLDIVVLAMLYTLRVLAGAALVGIALSGWFLAFALFVFFALAVAKRQAELAGADANTNPAGRPYTVADGAALTSLNAAAAFAAIVVLLLYSQSADVAKLYSHPQWLWLICPPLMYWLGRMLLLAGRGAIGDDPVAFAARDRATYLCAAVCIAVFWFAVN